MKFQLRQQIYKLTTNPTIRLLLLTSIILILSRVIPHPANVTPILSISLLLGNYFSRTKSTLVIIATLFCSDFLIGLCSNFNAFGDWSFFTYSGFILICISASNLKSNVNSENINASTKLLNKILMTLCASGVYWLWTNFGSWLSSGLYTLNLSGLISCYTLALPFLRNALLGDTLWTAIIFSCLYFNPRIIPLTLHK